MRYRVLPYKQGSASAKALADALGGKVLKLFDSKFMPKPEDVVINWGCCIANAPTALNGDIGRLKGASNKLLFFENMAANAPDIIPKYWTNKEDIPHEEFPIVCRTVLAGHSGAGIVIADSPADAVACKLYVKYEKKKDEYRVHVGRDHACQLPQDDTYSIISVQRKARRSGVDNPNWQVRNLAGGFVYVRGGVNPPSVVLTAATAALSASGLDFGAVDVIYNDKKDKAYVLEINTAPGLEGQTVTDYANYFKAV